MDKKRETRVSHENVKEQVHKSDARFPSNARFPSCFFILWHVIRLLIHYSKGITVALFPITFIY